MTNKELVSIIIPVYNSCKYIDECIDSVLNQDYSNIEVIVVDDGSTDGSFEKLRGYENSIKLSTQANSGAPVARNRGLRLSRGKYVKFLDSDDYLEPKSIGEQVDFAEQSDDGCIVYGDYLIKENNSARRIKTKLKRGNQTAALILQDIMTSTPLHRREHLLSVGGFDRRFLNGQEWELHVRLAARGYRFRYYKKPIYTYKKGHSENTISEVSARNAYQRLLHDLQKSQWLYDAIIGNEDALSAIARKSWWTGRECMGLGFDNLAEKAFRQAKSMSEKWKSQWPISYRIGYELGGLEAAERMLAGERDIKHKIKSSLLSGASHITGVDC